MSKCDVTNPAVIIVIRDLYMDYYCKYSGMAKLPELCEFIIYIYIYNSKHFDNKKLGKKIHRVNDGEYQRRVRVIIAIRV